MPKIPLLPVVAAFALALPTVSSAASTPLACARAEGIQTLANVELGMDNVELVHVTFVGQRPPNKEIDRVLRDCLAIQIKRSGSRDILATPWLRQHANDNPANDDMLSIYGPLRALVYVSANRTVEIHTPRKKK